MATNLSRPGDQGFERLQIWKDGVDLACRVYDILKSNSDYGLRNQMQRAAVSISSNIAEGYDRGTNKEFIRFLQIARGSSAELRTQAYFASDQVSSQIRMQARSLKLPDSFPKGFLG